MILPPHKHFELESSHLRYRIFCSYTVLPECKDSVARDLYIVANEGYVFYKESLTIKRQGQLQVVIVRGFETRTGYG